MVRPIGILAGLGFVGVVLWSFLWGVVAVVPVYGKYGHLTEPTATSEFHLPPKEVSFSFEGPMGKYDKQQLQRGYQVYKEVCSACHSLKFVAFRDLEQIGFTPAEVKAIAKSWTVPSIDPKTGEPSTRPGVPADHFPLVYANDTAARAAQNNAIPPDQSLLPKAREEGPHYIYSLITGYQDQPATLLKKYPDAKTPDGLHYNPYFANLNLAMAPPLVANQVTYAPGNPPATLDQEAKDVVAFLTWAAEPKLEARHTVGWAALIYLLVFTGLAYAAYRTIWADKKGKA